MIKHMRKRKDVISNECLITMEDMAVRYEIEYADIRSFNMYPVIDMLATGQNIKRILNMKGLSIRDIQRYLGFTAPQSIYHWFDGKSLPTIDNLYALSQILDLPIDSMIIGNRKNEKASATNRVRTRVMSYYKQLLG